MRDGLTGLARELFANKAERDPEFQENVTRASLMSLRAVGLLECVVPVLMLTAGLAVIPLPSTQGYNWVPNALFAVLGAGTFATAYTAPGRRWPRFFIAISIWISVAIIVWSALVLAEGIAYVEHHLLGYISLVMFGAAAAVPMRPLQTLALGTVLDVFYLGSLVAAHQWLAWEGSGIRLSQHAFVFLITLLCTALTFSVYRQRIRGYEAHQQALRTAEELREAQNRLLIADNAAVMGRVSAALSHELNTPIGALASAVDTLASIGKRMAAASPEQQERLKALLDQAAGSGKESAKRLREIVSRMQRFTNLDRADVQSANLNTLLGDVIALVGSEHGVARSNVVAELGDVPQFFCRPQQLSAVFSNLLHNALNSVDAGGRVVVSTRNEGSHTEVRFTDNGRGIPPDQMAVLFDPGAFHVSGGRMTAGNWSLFSCRQIIREHGGDITLTSSEAGTNVVLRLPDESPLSPIARPD